MPASAESRLLSGVTSLGFSPTILTDLGIEIVDVDETGDPLRQGALGFAVEVEPSTLELRSSGEDFEGFAAADLHHGGGFALQLPGTRLELAGFRLTATANPHQLALGDAAGQRWLLVDRPQGLRSSGLLSLDNADLLLAPELAVLLGRPDLASSYVGVLDARLGLASTPEAAVQGAAACVGDVSQPVDLLMVSLSNLSQAAREPGGRVAMAPGATLRNLGPGDVAWYRTIAPDSPVGPHPFLVLNFYRLSGGVLEQVGHSDVKHTFFASNSNCACPGGSILYAGCEDFYGASTNLDRQRLAPRDEVDPFARTWTSLGSHFDGIPVDDTRDHYEGDHDSFEHRLVVMEADLQTPGARYFYDGWYMAPNDTDLRNSMGFREVAPSFDGSTWSFQTIDAGTTNGSILDVWVDPQAPPAGALNVVHNTGEGRVQLAVETTELGGGVFHYEYALMNFDFRRAIGSFAIPLAPGQTVWNTAFGDAGGDPLDDWSVTIADGEIRFTAPPGNELGWGRLYNFRMDVDGEPVPSLARLTSQAGAAPLVSTLGPAAMPIPALPGWTLGALLATLATLGAVLLRRRRARS